MELLFATSGLTRASVTADINTKGSRFAVCGDMKNVVSENSGNKPTVIFYNTEVEYDGSSWSYGDTRYWLPKYEYSFVAIYPTSVLSGAADDLQYSNSTLSSTYTIPVSDGEKINTHELVDIIAATHRRGHTDNSATPVNLKFFHIMSRINFLLSLTGTVDKVRVTEIELEGVNKTGTFAVTPATLTAGSRTDDYTLSWTDISGMSNLVAEIDTDVNNGDTQPLFPDDNAMFMIPQPENKEIIMKITYIYDHGEEQLQQTMVAQTPIGGWEAGKMYSYSLALDIVDEEVNMSFDVNVTDWKEGASNDVSVPRK
ncbi:MAG: fimbrillin family protein [Paramuribaculum sp.]|nr:fimbrillin family protein [Paramuribaculum sp.]